MYSDPLVSRKPANDVVYHSLVGKLRVDDSILSPRHPSARRLLFLHVNLPRTPDSALLSNTRLARRSLSCLDFSLTAIQGEANAAGPFQFSNLLLWVPLNKAAVTRIKDAE